ncbi:MAG: Asp-tRNA(Asn)/Glu-tRNA(Gln) amidotransferase subunit GatB [Endomicrobiia bacterium]|nr:Asp-tRNA(Asn)/Glu-tRNA(Gln) amidotransferase subunit GatB [Endomicrobiia bacterium]
MNNYEAVIGLEVHTHLKTSSKAFCSCSTEFASPPNTNICPVCTGQPGVLPVLNGRAVELIARSAFALGCRINKKSIFARKHYFYPDLPKNFQISQYELPVAEDGFLEIKSDEKAPPKKIRIKRIHLEEDTGKLLHAVGSRELDHTLVDYNRAGIPLMEIVTEPDIASPEEAWLYLNALKSVLEYCEVSDCNMEEGKFRCDANVSIRPVGQTALGVKTELKNMNTTKGVRDALGYEIKRQTEVLSSGGLIFQETRLWDTAAQETRLMRAKEEANDYRYFPEPDLPPLELSEEFLTMVAKQVAELPSAKRGRFVSEYGLSDYDAGILTAQKTLADYFEAAARALADKKPETYKLLANWVINELLGRFNARDVIPKGGNFSQYDDLIQSASLAEIVNLISSNAISGKAAKIVFEEIAGGSRGKTVADIVKEKNLVQITDEGAIKKYCQDAITENPVAVGEYRSGKERALGALVGAAMKKSSGRANPSAVNAILKDLLK